MMLPRRSVGVRMHCRIRRFVRRSRPVRFGQTPLGLVVAAALIFLWGLERPAAAEFVFGSSSNEYFTLSWVYDLDGGWGTLGLFGKDLLATDGVALREVSFTTRGVAPDCTAAGVLRSSGLPVDLGIDNGQRIYQYNFRSAGMPYIGLSAICSANLRFPTTGLELVPGKMTIVGDFIGGTSGIASGMVSGMLSGLVRQFGPVTMDYVTVQAIPEPATIALVGAAAVVGAMRRRREDGQDRENA